jgi:hypothetical protein
VLKDGELDEKEVVAFFATTTKHGAIEGKVQEHQVAFYNLDMIISVGYRVHSYRGVQFRIWATKVLKEFDIIKIALYPLSCFCFFLGSSIKSLTINVSLIRCKPSSLT